MTDYEHAIQDWGLLNLFSDTCLISVEGSDSRSFLNGLLTNNIKTLQKGMGCYTCVCSPKGKILADLFCYAVSDSFFILESRRELKNKILDLLKKYALNQKIKIREGAFHPEAGNLAFWGGRGILGTQAHSWFQKVYPGCLLPTDLSHEHFVPPDQNTEEPKGVWIKRKNMWGYPCYEIWRDCTLEWNWEGEWPHQQVNPIEPEKYLSNLEDPSLLISKSTQEILRIESKTPLYGVDMDENTIPQEANLFHALNFKKGCYVGQETIARLQNLGHVNKQLVLLKIEGNEEVPKESKIITQEGKEIGFITSQCFSPKYKSRIALGYIRYAHLGEKEFKIGQRSAKILY